MDDIIYQNVNNNKLGRHNCITLVYSDEKYSALHKVTN